MNTTVTYFQYNKKLSNYLVSILQLCKFIERLQPGPGMNRLERDTFCELADKSLELCREVEEEEFEHLNTITEELRIEKQTLSGDVERMNKFYSGVQDATNQLIADFNDFATKQGFVNEILNYRLVHRLDGEAFPMSATIEELVNDLKIRITNLDQTVNRQFNKKEIQGVDVKQPLDKPIGSKDEYPQQWRGTSKQKSILFDGLQEHGFIGGDNDARKDFLNNKVIQWLGSGRDLFYLLEELKAKKYKLLDINLELVPFIRRNFVDKNGNPFRNINQNKSGLTNVNKNSKPRNGSRIDEILKTLHSFTV